MTADPFDIGDPFELTTSDERDELASLTRALTLAEGFVLYIVRCNQPHQRRQLIDKLKRLVPHMTVQNIEMNQPVYHLLHALQLRLTEPRPDAVFVSGLEHSLPSVTDAHASTFVTNLNVTRDSFPTLLRCPLVLWIPEYVLLAIWRGAPDFFSICSGVYYFLSAQNEMTTLSRVLTLNEIRETNNLLIDEKKAHLKTIKDLLTDYQSIPSEQRDYQAEKRLSIQLAHAYYGLGDYQIALEHLQYALLLSLQISDREGKANILTKMAAIYLILGLINKAVESYNQALEIYREHHNRKEESYTLDDLGTAYLSLGRSKEAIDSQNQALLISRELRDRLSESNILVNLGMTYRELGRINEAIDSYSQALTIQIERGDRRRQARTLGHLGYANYLLGRTDEALAYHDQALPMIQQAGDHQGEADLMNHLGVIYRALGHFTQAAEYYHRVLAIRRKTGDATGEGMALDDLGLTYQSLGDTEQAKRFWQNALDILPQVLPEYSQIQKRLQDLN